MARDRSLQCAFFRTPKGLIIGVACLASACFVISLLANGNGNLYFYFTSVGLNLAITMIMTVAFLRPLWDIWGLSKTLRSVFIRTAAGAMVHLICIVTFFVLQVVWLITLKCSSREHSIFVQFMLLALQGPPMLIHICLSHRDDLALLTALRHCTAAATARWARDGAMQRWDPLDESEQAEVRRLSQVSIDQATTNSTDRGEGDGGSVASAELGTINPVHHGR